MFLITAASIELIVLNTSFYKSLEFRKTQNLFFKKEMFFARSREVQYVSRNSSPVRLKTFLFVTKNVIKLPVLYFYFR